MIADNTGLSARYDIHQTAIFSLVSHMGFAIDLKKQFRFAFAAVAVLVGACVLAPEAKASIAVENTGALGVIKGVIRDGGGNPISDATVAIFRLGTAQLLKQVRSGSDGSFLTKVLPGTYTILAVAEGYNPVTLSQVEVSRSAELYYGFKLERSGQGNTLPEKRLDRNSSKWRIRASQSQRSIYQNQEGSEPAMEAVAAADEDAEKKTAAGRIQTVVESYVAETEDDGPYTGLNFATLVPLGARAQVVLAGQIGTGRAPARIETNLAFRPNDNHQIRVSNAFASLGTVNLDHDSSLSQFSFQATDEWKVREGVIVVFGVDYSKFLGAGSDFSLSPRLGFQLDLDPKTRLRAAYTSQTENKSWAHAIELEDMPVAFTEPVAVDDFVVTAGKPQLNKSNRLEFGIERVLDNNSSVEANVFFDTTLGRGVGLNSLPFDTLDGTGFGDFVSNQQGRSTGFRLVYSRRINSRYSTAAGYSFGRGQQLSDEGFSSPSSVFENAYFQSFFGQFEADIKTGTNVKTIFRLSPDATVFAIDPFQGRLAIYDPSLSVLVTQNLPTLGLPFHAQAIVDARNLFDFQPGVTGDEGTLRMSGQRRMLRGGILVRF